MRIGRFVQILILACSLFGCSKNSKNEQMPIENINVDDDKSNELDDLDIISLIANSQFDSEQVPMSSPGLDEVWRDYLEYKEDSPNNILFLCETKLLSDENYTCYYLPKTTISKIEQINEIEQLSYMSDDSGNINYIRYYKKLFDENRLLETDTIMISKESVQKKSIQKYIDDYCLVKITRDINIANKSLGNSFIENIQYKEDDLNVLPNTDTLSERLDSKKVIINNVPYLKHLFENDIFPSSFLNIFAYLVDEINETFETHISYHYSVIEKDEHYYDSLDSIILEKHFVTKMMYFDNENNKQYYDCYEIICDYKKTKTLFNF